MDQHEEIWLVQLANGSVRVMTLDELDAAFQDGSIDEDTFVRRDGGREWVRLRDEIGASEPPPSYTPPPVYNTTPQVQLYSTRPVVSEIDDFELEQPFKKSRKGTYAAVGLIGAAAVAAAVFGAKHFAAAPADSVNASVAAAAQPPQAAPPPPPVTAAPASTLSEDQKKALSDLDKKHEKTWEQQRVQRQSQHASHSTYHPSHTPFHKGGNKYDPLNAKL